MNNKNILVKGYILFKTGYPEKLYGEAIRIYKTPQEAEEARDGYVHLSRPQRKKSLQKRITFRSDNERVRHSQTVSMK
jgi:hypothetical protein